MNLDQVLKQLRRYLDGELNADSLCDWYFDEWRSQTETFSEDEHRVLFSTFLDLDEYLPPKFAHCMTEYDIDEVELRVRLTKHAATLATLINIRATDKAKPLAGGEG